MNVRDIRTGMRVISPNGAVAGTVAALTEGAILLRSAGPEARLQRVPLGGIASVDTEVYLRYEDNTPIQATKSRRVVPQRGGIFPRAAIIVLLTFVTAVLVYALFFYPHRPHG